MTYQRHVRARSWQVTLILTLFFVAVAGAAGIGWWYARESPPHKGPIVLITIDGLRADAIAPPPQDGATAPISEPVSPALADLAADAVVFDRAYVHSAQLLPAQASLLSGQLPYEHGVRDDAGFVLRPETLTLPELLRNRGFNTGAAVSSFLLRTATGIGRGFSTYTEADNEEAQSPQTAIARASASGPSTAPAANAQATSAPRVGNTPAPVSAANYLGTPTDRVTAPPGEQSIEAAAAFAAGQRGQRYFVMLQVDAAHAEPAVARLVSVLKEHRLYERATIILVGDRGRVDGAMDEDTLRVPLLVKQPEREGAGRHIAVTVQHIDLLPTILDLVRAPIPSELHGRSLRPLLTEASGRITPQPVYSESLAAAYRFGGYPTFALTLNDFRYVQSGLESLVRIGSAAVPAPAAPADADSSTTNGEMPPLRATLARMLAGHPLPRAVAVPPRDRDRLARAGILFGLQTVADPPILTGDQDDIAASHRDAAHLVGLGRLAPAVRALQQIVRTDANLAAVQYQIGVLSNELGRTADAIAALTQAQALRPDSPEVARALALTLLRAGRLTDAQAAADTAIKASEEFGAAEIAAAHETAARIALARGEPDAALAHADAVQSANPSIPMRAFIQGAVLAASVETTDREEAARVLRGAVAMVRQRDGALEGLQLALGQTLVALDQPEPAEAAFRAELADFPRSVAAYSELAQLLQATDRVEDAALLVDALVAAVPTPDGYATAARLWMALGETARAADVRSDARGRFPAESAPARTARVTPR